MSLSDHRGKWIVLFFYPRDFTFICPTEIVAYGSMQDQFENEGAVLLGASTDSFYSHKAWFESEERLRGVRYPVLADTSQQFTRAFGILLEDGAALRGTYIVDPEGRLRHMSVNDLDVGRNVEEPLRILQALRCGQLCPAAWRPGAETLTTYNEWLAGAFPRLTKSVLADATNRLQTVELEAGQIIIRQGDEADRFYIVVAGEVAVVRKTEEGAEIELATLSAGDVFGEMGILTETRRNADVRARSKVELLALDWADFKGLLDSSDATARDFIQMVDQRRAMIPG
jgi:peroxiredoxin (alkyl hydroperoxide reductase subunit C)